MKKILVIDDDQAVLNYLNIMLLQTGAYKVTPLANSSRAFQELKQNDYDLLLLDMDMPEVSGLDILRHIREKGVDIETIVLTGVEDVELAVAAMKLGAFDYLTKPVDNDQLLKIITAVLEGKRDRAGEAAAPAPARDALAFPEAFQEILTQDAEMLRIFQMVEKMAQPDNSILIWGESGTGKELIAKAIHRISRRRDQHFVAVNAGVFANELFASEFFGHDKGAFTGASAAKKGFLEEADKGTLFLDEIGELALPIQVKLLRVLQEGEFFRLGSTKNQKVDVRIIAATNQDLLTAIAEKRFRQDLYYRLNVARFELPPLRERKEDIPLLVQFFLDKYNKKNSTRARIGDGVFEALAQHDFPGNVRELENLVEQGVALSGGGVVGLDEVQVRPKRPTSGTGRTLAEVVDSAEKDAIDAALRECDGNRERAAEILDISPTTLWRKMTRLGITFEARG